MHGKRAQVSIVIKVFINEIKIYFSTTVRLFRTNNALEYTKKEVSHFCASQVILHQNTYSHTSQQNEAVKRKLRHLLDVAHTFLIHMYISKTFWVKVIPCACHLINRMPSHVLHDIILISCMYHDKPMFSVVSHFFLHVLLKILILD